MADDRVQLPSSGGGLIRYFDEYRSRISLKPMYVVIFIVVFILFEIYLHKTKLFG
ncbi:MAG: preprotein translocase subunit Sec61beta [Candidatus Nanoarchaeia archaeon]|nr:preprotein translocase subunit Sec61beta [Candidatus Nanoarchaeia archaeon]